MSVLAGRNGSLAMRTGTMMMIPGAVNHSTDATKGSSRTSMAFVRVALLVVLSVMALENATRVMPEISI